MGCGTDVGGLAFRFLRARAVRASHRLFREAGPRTRTGGRSGACVKERARVQDI